MDTDREFDPIDRECDDCRAEPGEPCRSNCSSRWTTPPLDDDERAVARAREDVPPRSRPTDMPSSLLEAALARGAAGVYAAEAGVRLVVGHGSWPTRLAHHGLVDLDDDPQSNAEPLAWIRWADVVTALDDGRLYASGSAARLLRVAASLGAGEPVDLSEAVTGLDRHNLALMLAALSHANGSQAHKEFLGERPLAGGPLLIRADSPRIDLGPVFDWPEITEPS